MAPGRSKHMQISIIIPHHVAAGCIGLWATIMSCEEDLRTSIHPHTYEYIIVANGGDLDLDVKTLLEGMKRGDKNIKLVHFQHSIPPPEARTEGAKVATGDLLCFFDNHCILGQRYFDRVCANFEANADMASLHGITRFLPNGEDCYHYELTLAHNFWSTTEAHYPGNPTRAYRIGMSGHGAFTIRREVWEAVEGYGPAGLFKGYGGEESLFDLKLARMGYQNYMEPWLSHSHYASDARGYDRHYTDEYYINLLVAANCIGGDEWFKRVAGSFINDRSHYRHNPHLSVLEMCRIAKQRSDEYRKELDLKCKYTLNECLKEFRVNGVAI